MVSCRHTALRVTLLTSSPLSQQLDLDNPRTRREHSLYLDRLWNRPTQSGPIQGPITYLLPLHRDAPPPPPTPAVGVVPDLLRVLFPTLNGQPARASDLGNTHTRLKHFSRRQPTILRQLATVTTTVALQQAAVAELELFKKESGMLLKIKKCMLTGFDFKNNETSPQGS